MTTVALFAMGEPGHFQRLLPLVGRLARRGARPVVFTDRRFAPAVQGAGGEFEDLFANGSVEDADPDSRPFPSRFVTFADAFGTAVARRAAARGPSLVIADAFAVVGRVVAGELGLPRVNVLAGHRPDPARFLAMLQADPRVATSDRCRRAVEGLARRPGFSDASPFCYVGGWSGDLNLCAEPPEFLPAGEREALEPLAFFGSLPDGDPPAPRRPRPPSRKPRIYLSFGTVVWRYYAREALRAIARIGDGLGRRASILASLGGAPVAPEDRADLARRGVFAADYVDQGRVLDRTDLFFTHHGLNSTHEAIWRLVPMAACPFFWDQPALAERCVEIGVTTVVGDGPRAGLTAGDAAEALDRTESRRPEIEAALATAQGWEARTIERRDETVDRLLALARTAG